MILKPVESKMKYRNIFDQAYDELNEEQKIAVDQIEGPVMVIAGPGTGKTQILAVRIGRILLDTDTQPHNILCLTYTDAASISMRDRLVQIIGPDAHRVHIHTFHSFCNQVIQENLGIFGNYRQLEPISDLERIACYEELILQLQSDHPLKRLKGDPRYVIRQLRHLFSLMKKENYNQSDIDEVAQSYLEALKSDPDMIYKRSGKGYSKGDFKQKAFDEAELQMKELRAGGALFEDFEKIMNQKGRYDFDDMILWVLRAFENHPELLLQYQERYHYFLIDEFQDTNGAQKNLLDHLVSYWSENPNVFVVGDDDQAIYKFQGANMGNISEFFRQYKPLSIVMAKNYRSNQEILNVAMGLIQYNQERIVNDEDFTLDKKLTAMTDDETRLKRVTISSYQNPTQEQAALVNTLEEWYKAKDDLSDFAIIYRNHRQVEKLVEVLEKKGIPINIRRRVNILNIPLVKNILTILEFINLQFETKKFTDRILFEIMHFNFFEIAPSDVSKLMWTYRTQNETIEKENHINLSQVISDRKILEHLELKSENNIASLIDRLNKWIADLKDVTLQVLFQNVLNEGMILNYILNHSERSWLLQVVGTLFDLIKLETSKNPDFELSDFLTMIDEMKKNEIPLQINKVVSSEKGAHFLTAHSSKGLEFEYVHILGATKDIWDGKNSSWGKFKYPEGINGDDKANIEDERRLFYVAMTRAKTNLTMSYSLSTESGKGLGSSQFVDEIRASSQLEVDPQSVNEDLVVDYQYLVLKKEDKPISLLDHDLIDRVLSGYKLSVTGLNKYLKCPITFYYETILKVPMARTKYLGFGRAIHFALEHFYRNLNLEQGITEKALIDFFNQGMLQHQAHFTIREFEDMSSYGQIVLSKYFAEYLENFVRSSVQYALEVKIENAEYQGVPIKGVLDRVDIQDYNAVVTDYKTGNFQKPSTRIKLKSPDDKTPQGGDYWRQIVFYKLLMDSDQTNKWRMHSGVIDFIEPDRKNDSFKQQQFFVSNEHVQIVGRQITETWKKINEHQFEKGCGEDDCYWCDFVQNNYVMDYSLIEEMEFTE